MSRDESPTAHALQQNFLLLTVAMVTLLFLWMIGGFLMALLLAAITAGLLHPLHVALSGRLGDRPTLAAAIEIVGLVLLVIGPISTLLGIVVGQAVQVSQAIGPWVEARIADPDSVSMWIEGLPIWEWLPIEPMLPDRERVIEVAGNTVRATGRIFVDMLAAAGRGTATFLLQVFIYLYGVFFFLLAGRETLERVLHLSPLDHEDESLILERFLSVTKATLKGSLLIGGIQGFMTGVGFAVAGVPGAAFWGSIVVVLSVIPGIGAPIVWIPATLWLAGTGATGTALGLALWCGLVVGTIDNVLRPRLVGSDARMSDLMILISTLGGISLFGATGFVVGPILAAVFVTLWDVYGRTFAEVLPPTAGELAAAAPHPPEEAERLVPAEDPTN